MQDLMVLLPAHQAEILPWGVKSQVIEKGKPLQTYKHITDLTLARLRNMQLKDAVNCLLCSAQECQVVAEMHRCCSAIHKSAALSNGSMVMAA